MKTGNHIEWEDFIRFADLECQNFEMTGMWYDLHNYNLENYDRRIAFVDYRPLMDFTKNKFYNEDLKNRINYLKSKKFTIVFVNLWECKKFHNSDNEIIWAGDVSFFWYKMYHRYKNKKFKFNHVQKPYDFLYLNKSKRSHRDLLFDKLVEKNILSNSLYSYIFRKINLKTEYELPQFRNSVYPLYGNDRDIFEPPFNSTKFNIVSETTVHDEAFITEKTWKPIIAGQIFIIHGKRNHLNDLKSLGFRSYEKFIDESYDDIESLQKRTDAIVKLCNELKDKSHIKLYADTKEIREHNQKIFFSEQHCKNACQITLKNLFKLIDSSQISS